MMMREINCVSIMNVVRNVHCAYCAQLVQQCALVAVSFMMLSLLAADGVMEIVDDFEAGNLNQWVLSESATADVRHVASPTRAGQGAVMMKVTSSTDRKRAELTSASPQGYGNFHSGNEYWMGFSFYIEDWGTPIPDWSTLFQTHAVPHIGSNGKPDWSTGTGKNSITLTTSGHNINLNVIVNPDQSVPPSSGAIADRVWTEALKIGEWDDWVIRYRPSIGSDGIITVWRNGVQIFTQSGANLNRLDLGGFVAPERTYFKMGVYCKNVTSTQIMYYDEVRKYKGSDGYDMVVPRGATPPPPVVIAVTGVDLSPEQKTLTLGAGGSKSTQLTATVRPTNASNKTLSFSSSDNAIATVTSSGLVTAVAVGTAVITVTTEDGNKTAAATITCVQISPPITDETAPMLSGRTWTVHGQSVAGVTTVSISTSTGTLTTSPAGDGTWSLSIPLLEGHHSYDVVSERFVEGQRTTHTRRIEIDGPMQVSAN